MALDELSFFSIGTAGNGQWGNRIPLTLVTGPAGFSAVIYQCKMVEDIDGAPTTYAPPGSGLTGLDGLPNATSNPAAMRFNLNLLAHPNPKVAFRHDFRWVGVIHRAANNLGAHPPLRVDAREALRDENGEFPAIQQVDPAAPQPAPGFYVSASATVARPEFTNEWDQRRFWNALTTPYCALTPALNSLTRPGNFPADAEFPPNVGYGDFGLAIRNTTGVAAPFFFGDWGNESKVGESSRNLFRALFPDGDNEHGVSFIVFPGSGASPIPTAGMIRAGLKIQFATLSLATNAERLIATLAASANLTVLENIARPTEQQNSEMRTREYGFLTQAFRSWGYQPRVGDFRGRQQPTGDPVA